MIQARAAFTRLLIMALAGLLMLFALSIPTLIAVAIFGLHDR